MWTDVRLFWPSPTRRLWTCAEPADMGLVASSRGQGVEACRLEGKAVVCCRTVHVRGQSQNIRNLWDCEEGGWLRRQSWTGRLVMD